MRPVTVNCAEPGCRKRAFYEVRTKAEDLELRRKPWRCVRHARPETVLSTDAPLKRRVLVLCEESYGKFWRPEGQGDRGGSAYVHGPGFQAFGQDFPVGTRIVVEARLEAV